MRVNRRGEREESVSDQRGPAEINLLRHCPAHTCTQTHAARPAVCITLIDAHNPSCQMYILHIYGSYTAQILHWVCVCVTVWHLSGWILKPFLWPMIKAQL